MIELKALQGQVRALVEDLRRQVAEGGELRTALQREYGEAKTAERTGATFDGWVEDPLDQAAVAWVLGCVFVRFCEDNQLVEPIWIGGSEPDAPAERAMQARQAYIIAEPLHNDRHWLREAFGYLAGLRPTGRLFDGHNPVWRFDISGEAAEALSDFFRRGAGAVSLQSSTLDTRFLGDLYQDLSAHARSTYALLQTPVFVEEFILDRAFEPAVTEFGLAATSVIDPTCGSGHFLLGAFERLVRKWQEREPATGIRDLVERALGQITGVDINPFAVAIARFRLMIAALKACELSSLERAPTFQLRVATGDSLLPWGEHKAIDQPTLDGEASFAYATEDEDVLPDYLKPSQYTVVVGNPPYITVKDKALNEKYRALYPACAGSYAMTVPFAQRFFGLAARGDHNGLGAGWVGQITANSFMKREFGKKLVTAYLANKVELNEIVDTSGAFIPGHGTPTVILIGHNRLMSPRYSGPVRGVLGIRGEPSAPADPSKGLVWSAIVGQIDEPGSVSDWMSVVDMSRERLAMHPWSLTGGGASDIIDHLRTSSTANLHLLIGLIGFGAVTREDDAYAIGRRALRRHRIKTAYQLPMVDGEATRDWSIHSPMWALWPYDLHSLKPILGPSVERLLWPHRTSLSRRVAYGETQLERGLQWFEYSMFFEKRFAASMSIAFAGVATHNHFVFDRGGKVFNRWAPVIKLPEGATEDDHLRLLGVLNSSTACFWLKQVSHDKGSQSGTGGFMHDEWERFYEFTGTKLQEFPLPGEYPVRLATRIDDLARSLALVAPDAIAATGPPVRGRLDTARKEWRSIRARMIAAQEELDWLVYRLYGLADEDLGCGEPPEIQLGERAFEVILARRVAAGSTETVWFARHGSTPITELPKHWPEEYRSLVERRIAIIESNRNIALIERPEHKRRWATDGWDAMQAAALREWLLDRLEAETLWGGEPTPLSVAQLADRVRHDDDFRSVLDLWIGTDQHDLVKSLGKLVADEHVPYLPIQRYKPAGLRKRVEWERTWALQRREDRGEKVEIAVPSKYTSADFIRSSYWRNRGKLDVPKERFVSYPGAGRDGDPTELLGWAGWDHLGQARALAGVYLDRKTQAGWGTDRLLPLLAGLLELEPWLRQWYTDPQPGFVGSPADFFTGLIDSELSYLGTDRASLAKVRGVEVTA